MDASLNANAYGSLSGSDPNKSDVSSWNVTHPHKKHMFPKWFLRTVAITIYFIIGCIYYGLSPSLQWEPFKVFYFICVSITTCGYGDIVPTTDPDKLFTVFYVTFGIAVVFGAISDAAMIFFQHLEDKAEEDRKRKEKERLLSEGRKEEAIPDTDDDIFRHERMKILFYLSFVAAVMVIGGTTVSVLEDMSFISGLYWAFQTTTTVGYGDETLENTQARVIASIYLLLSCGVVGSALAGIAGAKDATKRELKQRRLLRKNLDMDMISALDEDGDGVDKTEFLVGMLVAMELVDKDILDQLLHRFEELDADGSGRLDADDLARASTFGRRQSLSPKSNGERTSSSEQPTKPRRTSEV